MDKKITLLILSVIALCNANVSTINGRIKIQVGTASGCGDTVNFIGALGAVYDVYGEFLDIEFVPWSRTVNQGNGVLSCQFGKNDCWANRLHRCVISKAPNQDVIVSYMRCEFSSPYPSYLLNSYQCAENTGISLVELDNCVNQTPGDELDLHFENLAREPMRIINFVPAIVFNDQIDARLSTQARSSLMSMVCFALADDPSTGVTGCNIN